MGLLDNTLYYDDVIKVANLPYEWEKLDNKTLLITGASGMIGSFLIDVIMQKNKQINKQKD
jgi:FlaA1/EpsC-like NDP-sugar epimerase